MKNIIKKTALSGVIAASLGATFSSISIANAKPNDREVRSDRRELKQDRKEIKRDRKELKRDQNDRRDDRRDDNRGHNTRRSDGGYTGVVTNVHSRSNFDVRINNSGYNVYLNGSSPRGLSVGDTVRVTGVRVGGNDIRQAQVSIIRNR